MIDSHIHSEYSKHATGSIENIVITAIKNNIKTLTITDHAPFPIDINNRLLEEELKCYFDDIEHVKDKYSKDITILKGLEVDFLPTHIDYIKNLLQTIEVDFLIGSIHSVYLDDKKVNVWEIHKLNNHRLIEQYFVYLKELIESELFDTIGHPDSILRGGINEGLYCSKFNLLVPLMKAKNISYELNASGLRKSTYDIQSKTKKEGIWNYPSKLVISILNDSNISFTVGSDAHSPRDIYSGVETILQTAKKCGVENICYYQNRDK